MERTQRRTEEYAEFCHQHLNEFREIVNSISTDVDSFWKYTNYIESETSAQFSDALYLTEAFMRFGRRFFLELNRASTINRERYLSSLITKYSIAEGVEESFELQIKISSFVCKHPLAVAYHLGFGENILICGELNGLPKSLAFSGGRLLIPNTDVWESLVIQWEMWKSSLIEDNIPLNSNYITFDYTVPQNFDQLTAMGFLDIQAPPPGDVLITLEELIRSVSVEKYFVSIDHTAPYIQSMFPEYHNHIWDYYMKYYYDRSAFRYRLAFIETRCQQVSLASSGLLPALLKGRADFRHIVTELDIPLESPVTTPSFRGEPTEDFSRSISPTFPSSSIGRRQRFEETLQPQPAKLSRRESRQETQSQDPWETKEGSSSIRTTPEKEQHGAYPEAGERAVKPKLEITTTEQNKSPRSSNIMVPTLFRRKIRTTEKSVPPPHEQRPLARARRRTSSGPQQPGPSRGVTSSTFASSSAVRKYLTVQLEDCMLKSAETPKGPPSPQPGPSRGITSSTFPSSSAVRRCLTVQLEDCMLKSAKTPKGPPSPREKSPASS